MVEPTEIEAPALADWSVIDPGQLEILRVASGPETSWLQEVTRRIRLKFGIPVLLLASCLHEVGELPYF